MLQPNGSVNMNSPVTGASINKVAATEGMHCGSRTQRNVKMKITIQKLTGSENLQKESHIPPVHQRLLKSKRKKWCSNYTSRWSMYHDNIALDHSQEFGMQTRWLPLQLHILPNPSPMAQNQILRPWNESLTHSAVSVGPMNCKLHGEWHWPINQKSWGCKSRMIINKLERYSISWQEYLHG